MQHFETYSFLGAFGGPRGARLCSLVFCYPNPFPSKLVTVQPQSYKQRFQKWWEKRRLKIAMLRRSVSRLSATREVCVAMQYLLAAEGCARRVGNFFDGRALQKRWCIFVWQISRYLFVIDSLQNTRVDDQSVLARGWCRCATLENQYKLFSCRKQH